MFRLYKLAKQSKLYIKTWYDILKDQVPNGNQSKGTYQLVEQKYKKRTVRGYKSLQLYIYAFMFHISHGKIKRKS